MPLYLVRRLARRSIFQHRRGRLRSLRSKATVYHFPGRPGRSRSSGISSKWILSRSLCRAGRAVQVRSLGWMNEELKRRDNEGWKRKK
jgi:hypothetical protein